jgi:hypothetical protein
MGNIKNLPNTELFATDHLYLAAYLICHGHEVAGFAVGDTSNTTRVQFLFTDSPGLRSTAADFMAGGKVDARQFSFALLKLKKSFPRNRQ